MAHTRRLPYKSTNVRVCGESRPLAVALAAWAMTVSLAALDGVFARLPAAVDLALAVFATLFAAATYACDEGVRAKVDASPWTLLALLALAGDVLALCLALDGTGALTDGAHALLALFALPLALAAHLPLLAALARWLPYVSGCEVTWRDPGRDLSSR